jgi:hypothetical protein
MKLVKLLPLLIVILLSLAAGLAKVMLVPQELAFLGDFGFTNSMIILYGIVQILSGVLVIPRKTRIAGSIGAAISFLGSTALILLSGNLVFTVVSFIPIGLSFYILFATKKQTAEGDSKQ